MSADFHNSFTGILARKFAIRQFLNIPPRLLLLLALRLGTVYRRSWGALLWTLPLGVVWRRSCSLQHMAFLLTLSSGVSRRRLEGAVRPFGQRLGWCRCTASQLVYSCHVFTPSFYSLLLHILSFYRLIVYIIVFNSHTVKCLHPLFVGAAIQIPIDWLIDILRASLQ